MNRKIKFRAWIDGEMIYIKEDLFISFFNFITCVDWAIYSRKYDNCIHKHDPTYKDEYEKNKLMQFIGYKDKNGKEIYEGDFNEDCDVVIWCEKCAGWQFAIYDFPTKDLIACHNCEGNFMFHDSIQDFKIKGNIYENKNIVDEYNA